MEKKPVFTDYEIVDSKVIYSGKDKLVFIVPEHYFTGPNAVIRGEHISLMGVLDYYTEDKAGKKSCLRAFFVPTSFITVPDKIVKMKNIKLTANCAVQDYRFLYYNPGDIIMLNDHTPEIIENTEAFFKMTVVNGRISSTIPVNRIHEYYDENIELNGESYAIDPHLMGIVHAEQLRDPEDLSKPYRLSKEFRENKNMYGFTSLSILQLPTYVSPAVNVTSRYFDDSIVQSILMKDENIKSSPLEDILYQK